MRFQGVFSQCAVFALMTQYMMVECEDYGQATLNYNGHTKKLSEHVVAMLEHFKQPDPVGLPWIDIPHVYRLPAKNKSSEFGTIRFINNTIYGLDKFRIKKIDVKFPEAYLLKFHVGLSMDALHLLGNVTLPSDAASSERYTVSGYGLNIGASITLRVKYGSELVLHDFTFTKFIFNNINTQVLNEGSAGAILENMVNINRNVLIDTFKPYLLEKVRNKIINAKVVGVSFPNILSPLDSAINAAKRKIIDPMYLEDSYIDTTGKLWSGRFYGLSTIHRIGDFNLKMENNKITTEFKVGLRKLEGVTHWTVYGFINLNGDSSLSIDYTTIALKLSQPLDVTKKPILEYFDIDVAGVKYIQNGSFALVFVENSIRELAQKIRQSILNSVKDFFDYEAQRELNKVDVENIIRSKLLPKLVQMERMGLKVTL